MGRRHILLLRVLKHIVKVAGLLLELLVGLEELEFVIGLLLGASSADLS